MKIQLNPANTESLAYKDDLNEGKSYVVIGIEADDYRVVNEQGKPYLYPAALFDVVDPAEPADWVSEFGEDGERYAYPPQLGDAGFFEDWFDGDPTVRTIFAEYLGRNL